MKSVSIKELSSGIRVKSVFCFLVAPYMRRKGITKLLLERVCQDAIKVALILLKPIPKKNI